MATNEPTQSERQPNHRVRIGVHAYAALTELSNKTGLSQDEIMTDLIERYDTIRVGGFGQEISHLISEIAMLESVAAALTKTNFLLIAEMRNLQRAEYIGLAEKVRESAVKTAD